MRIRRIIALVCLLAVQSCVGASKIAIFDEPGFPNASKRDAAFYRNTVGGDILGLKDLSRLKNYDTVIFPHGGYMPAAAEPYVSELMLRGGTVIVTGDACTAGKTDHEPRCKAAGFRGKIRAESRRPAVLVQWTVDRKTGIGRI